MHIKTGILFPRITIFQPTLVPVRLQQIRVCGWRVEMLSGRQFTTAEFDSCGCLFYNAFKSLLWNVEHLVFPVHSFTKLPHVIKVILIPASFFSRIRAAADRHSRENGRCSSSQPSWFQHRSRGTAGVLLEGRAHLYQSMFFSHNLPACFAPYVLWHSFSIHGFC